jgi:8-oxo-dGTP diphosphatase
MNERVMDVVCALILHEGKILGTRRTGSSSRAGKWEFPGGKVRPEEKPEKAIVREIDEELGMAVSVKHRFPHMVHHYPEIRIRLIPFLCEWKGGAITLKDHDRYAWIPSEKLGDYDWSEADKNLILMIQHTTGFSNDSVA